MVPSYASLIPLAPVALGAVALGRVVFETAHEDVDIRGVRDGADAAAVLAALSALAVFLLSLGPLHEPWARAFVGLLTGALWLSGRAARDARLAPLVMLTVGLLVGAEPRLGLALVPALGAVFLVTLRAPRALRVVLRAALVLLIGFLCGLLLERFGPRHLTRAPGLPDARALAAWGVDGAGELGPLGLALATGGLLLALVGAPARRVLALCAIVLAAMDAAAGEFGAASAVAASVGLGLGLMEARLRLARLALPGASLSLFPLVLLALVEPVSARLPSRLRMPTLGPVPPHDPPSAPRTNVPSRPARGSLDTARR